MIDSLKIGDNVHWHSAAGECVGEIVKIHLARNASKELIPWLSVKHNLANARFGTVTTLCGSESYLKVMKLRIVN